MAKDKTSQTAWITASLRALSNYEKDRQVNCGDDLAELFLPEERRIFFRTQDSRETIKKSIPKGMYGYVIARTQYFDGIYRKALQNDMGQIVLLGAGYDSRPYRFANGSRNTRIFEVDAQATQLHKLSLLRENKIEIRENISFVAVDFEKDDFLQLMKKSGFDESKQTLFLWEGVTFYLSFSAVLRMLKMIKENSASGSQLCFDFQTAQTGNDLIHTGLQEETIQFGLSGNIGDFVRDNGYTLIEHVDAKDMEKRFLTLENGELFEKIAPMMNFIWVEHR